MGELGSGDGSSYPGSLDRDAAIEVNAPAAGKTKASAHSVNDLAAAIIAIETELGVDPAGSKTNLVGRIDQEHESDGSHLQFTNPLTMSGLLVTTSGINTDIWGLGGKALEAVSNRVVVTSGGHLIPDGGIDAGGTGRYLKTKIIPIGAWDMDATGSVAVVHGLTKSKIRRFTATIISDDLVNHYSISHDDGTNVGGTIDVDATNVNLGRVASGFFDSVSYNEPSMNRGWIMIDYEA